MAFKSALPPMDKAPRSQSRHPSPSLAFQHALLNNLSLTSWLLIGGLLQSIILFLTPSTLALVPTITICAILLSRFAHTLLVTFGFVKNSYLENAILHRVAAQIPDTDGEFSDKTASEGVVCFHLGAKINHPLGIFSPNAKELGRYLPMMIKELDGDKSLNGYLGGSFYTSFDERGAIEITTISYWRSIEAVHQFAYSETHRKAWEWWNSLTMSQSQHLGINHEIFYAEPGQWEALYINFQPTLLGATTYLRKGDKLIGGTVEDKWISPLVDAKKGKLRSSAGRLGRQADSLYSKYEHEPSLVEYEKV